MTTVIGFHAKMLKCKVKAISQNTYKLEIRFEVYPYNSFFVSFKKTDMYRKEEFYQSLKNGEDCCLKLDKGNLTIEGNKITISRSIKYDDEDGDTVKEGKMEYTAYLTETMKNSLLEAIKSVLPKDKW